MSKLLHFTQLIFNMLKSVLGRALFRFVDKITIIMIMLPWNIVLNVTQLNHQITTGLFSYAE